MRSGKHFQDQIEQLATEVEFALQWQGPALLLALYRSSHVRDDAETTLSARLLQLGLNLVQVRVRSDASDVAATLAKSDRRNKAFSISALDQGGGEDGADAYRALNLHREYFIEENIRCVFWLTEIEAQRLSVYAPDFWAFRHRVIDLVSERATPERSALFRGLTWIDWPWSVFDDNLDAALEYRQRLLTDLPNGAEAAAMRGNLYGEIAGLYVQDKNWQSALDALDVGLDHTDSLNDSTLKRDLLVGRAIVLLQMERYEPARLALEKARTLTTENENILTLLAQTNRLSGRRSEALGCVQKATHLQPQHIAAWNEYGNICADLGRVSQALDAYQTACNLSPENLIPRINKGAVLASSNRLHEALELLRSVQAKQKLDLGAIARKQGFEFLKRL